MQFSRTKMNYDFEASQNLQLFIYSWNDSQWRLLLSSSACASTPPLADVADEYKSSTTPGAGLCIRISGNLVHHCAPAQSSWLRFITCGIYYLPTNNFPEVIESLAGESFSESAFYFFPRRMLANKEKKWKTLNYFAFEKGERRSQNT